MSSRDEIEPWRKANRHQWWALLAWCVFATFWGVWLSVATLDSQADTEAQLERNQEGTLLACQRGNERVRLLVQIAARNGLEVDPDIRTLNCRALVNELDGADPGPVSDFQGGE